MNREAYWLYIEPTVYQERVNNDLLLFNTDTKKALEYRNRPDIIRLLENKKTLVITGEDLQTSTMRSFITDIQRTQIGDVIPVSFTNGEPVNLFQPLGYEEYFGEPAEDDEVEAFTPDDIRDYNVTDVLNGLTLYVNNYPGNGCGAYPDAYKQFVYPQDEPGRKREIPFTTVKRMVHALVNEKEYLKSFEFNITGGNIFKYSKFETLVKTIADIGGNQNFIFHYDSLSKKALSLLNTIQHTIKKSRKYRFKPLKTIYSLRVFVTFPINEKKLARAVELVKALDLDVRYIFVITGEKELTEAENIVTGMTPGKVSLQPYYNGRNMHFFETMVYSDKEDILHAGLMVGEIWKKKYTNVIDAYKLTLLVNGDVYSNVNRGKLGNIGTDSLEKIIFTELTKQKNWLRVRSRVEPCNKCLYHALCPALSNYEYVLGRNNLCNVWKSGEDV